MEIDWWHVGNSIVYISLEHFKHFFTRIAHYIDRYIQSQIERVEEIGRAFFDLQMNVKRRYTFNLNDYFGFIPPEIEQWA